MRFFTFILLLSAVTAYTGCHRPNSEPETPEPRVEGNLLTLPETGSAAGSIVSSPVAKTGLNRQTFNGRILWNDDLTVRIFTPFAGRVTKVLAGTGDRVEKESDLALIASPDFGQAQSDARRAESDFQQAERNVNRLRELFEHGAAARKELDAAESDLARVRAEKERTASRLQFYGGNSASVDQIYPLKSPLSGIVVEKNINPGQEVRPDQMLANMPQFFMPLFVVTDPSRLWVQLDVAENDLRALKRGQEIIVRVQGLPDDKFTGKIDVISESLDPLTHTVKIRGSVDNQSRKLKAEMYVTVEIRGREPAELQVPSKAIFLQGDRHFLFIEEKPGIYLRREVKVRTDQGETAGVDSGIVTGDRVVTDGALLLEQMYQKAAGGSP